MIDDRGWFPGELQGVIVPTLRQQTALAREDQETRGVLDAGLRDAGDLVDFGAVDRTDEDATGSRVLFVPLVVEKMAAVRKELRPVLPVDRWICVDGHGGGAAARGHTKNRP